MDPAENSEPILLPYLGSGTELHWVSLVLGTARSKTHSTTICVCSTKPRHLLGNRSKMSPEGVSADAEINKCLLQSLKNGAGSTYSSTCLLKSTLRTTSDSHHRRGKHGTWRIGALWGQSDIQALNLTKYSDYCAGDNEMTKNLHLSSRTSDSSEKSCYIKDYLKCGHGD